MIPIRVVFKNNDERLIKIDEQINAKRSKSIKYIIKAYIVTTRPA